MLPTFAVAAEHEGRDLLLVTLHGRPVSRDLALVPIRAAVSESCSKRREIGGELRDLVVVVTGGRGHKKDCDA